MPKELKPKDIEVAKRYIETGNGLKSVQEAYPNKSYDAADKYFRRLSDNVRFVELINKAKEKATKELEFTVSDLFKRLKEWIDSDLTETMNLSAESVKELPIEIRRLITGFKTTEIKGVKTVELKFVSKEKAAEMIAKHIGFYGEHNSQKNKDWTDIKIGFE